MTESIYTAFFPFCGSGAGARGFLDGQFEILGRRARFRSLGGIDLDAAACRDFEYLTDSTALCADVAAMTAQDLIAFAGPAAPHVVFLSPPCKGSSGLLSEAKSKSPKYEAMNQLAVVWTRLMLAAWGTDPPALVLLENVPRMKKRAAGMLRQIRKLLRDAGYVFSDGFHDCGELGGLAQRRRRYLLVARHEKKVPPLLYQPIRRRVRACGEVLGPMPMPGDDAGGPMHALPRISWLNWVRLALFPGGLIKAHEKAGWKFHARTTVWKSPVTEMQRTKAHGLLYKQLRADSSFSRMGLPDYVLFFRRWAEEGQEAEPVRHTPETFPLDQWQEWASPVWMSIDQTDVLNVEQARTSEDEKHMCPLQLDLIERVVRLYSNAGDTVFSPFAGIGSEGVVSLRADRRFIGAELKPEYFTWAKRNLTGARAQLTLRLEGPTPLEASE